MTGPVAGIGGPPAGAATADPKARLHQAAQAFEAVFLRQVLATMRQSSLAEGVGEGDGTAQFREVGDAHLADTLARRGTLHVADLLERQYAARLPAAAGAGAIAVPGAAK